MVQTFTYLMSSLEGTAYKVLVLTKENVEQAVDTLKTRFGTFHQIISVHMQEILKLTTPSVARLWKIDKYTDFFLLLLLKCLDYFLFKTVILRDYDKTTKRI